MPTIGSWLRGVGGLDRPDLVRASLRVSAVSVAWTVIAGTASVTVGVVTQSAVLVALGSIGFVDAIGSAALVYHFLHGLRHESFSQRREAFAHRAVSLGLIVVGLAGTLGATYRLFSGAASDASLAGALIAAASLSALVVLAVRKHALGTRLHSRALIGDGRLSAIGAVQAGVALTGVAVTHWLGVGWTDASAAVVVSFLAVLVGASTWKASPSQA